MEEKTIGKKIQLRRKEMRLTQDLLAKKANIPYTTLAKIESDVVRNPSITTVEKIASALEITIDSLIKN